MLNPEPTITALFRKIALFSALPDEMLLPIIQKCALKRYGRAAAIIHDQDRTSDVFMILEGTVRVSGVSAGGREVTFNELHAGAIFGEFSAIDNLPRSAAVVALAPAFVARMTSESFVEMLETHAQVSFALVRLLVAKVRDLSGRMFEMSTQDTRQRVRNELARLAQTGRRENDTVLIKPAPTHYTIATKIGSHREAVTRELSRLARKGRVVVRRREIVILDPGWLEDGKPD